MLQTIIEYLFMIDGYTIAFVQFIPLAISAVSAIAGAAGEANKRKRMTAERNRMNTENNNWYNYEAKGDYTQRADVQNYVRQLREQLKEQNTKARNMGVVTGSTKAQEAAAQRYSADAMANLYSNIAARGQQHKDSISRQYRSRKYDIGDLDYKTMGEQAQSWNNTMYNGLKGIGNFDYTQFK